MTNRDYGGDFKQLKKGYADSLQELKENVEKDKDFWFFVLMELEKEDEKILDKTLNEMIGRIANILTK